MPRNIKNFLQRNRNGLVHTVSGIAIVVLLLLCVRQCDENKFNDIENDRLKKELLDSEKDLQDCQGRLSDCEKSEKIENNNNSKNTTIIIGSKISDKKSQEVKPVKKRKPEQKTEPVKKKEPCAPVPPKDCPEEVPPRAEVPENECPEVLPEVKKGEPVQSRIVKHRTIKVIIERCR